MAAKQPKIAIVHDWLVGGGAEWVVYELHKMFPDAPVYTSCATDEWQKRLDGKVVTGFLQHRLFIRLRKFAGILRIWWFSHLDLSAYDLVISSSGNGEAFGIRVPKTTRHICYCHSPTHYLWRHYEQYIKQPGFGVFDPLARLGLRILFGPLRRWDYNAAQRVDMFIANSTHIQRDIKQFYGRDAVVVHPPVDISRFGTLVPGRRHGFVTASRLVAMKHVDIIIQACTQLGLPLTVIGKGPDMERLQKLAGPTVTFTGFASNKEMGALLASAKGFIFASHEDFGITPVEALMTGTPVLAYRAGGALDYIQEGKTGAFFAEQTTESLASALKTFRPDAYDAVVIRTQSDQFSATHFIQKMQEIVDKNLPA